MVSRAVSVLLVVACMAVVANAANLAICRFQGSATISGWLTLSQEEEHGDVTIGANFTSTAVVSGLYMHIHQTGDLGVSGSCFSQETYGPWSSETANTSFTDSRTAQGFSLQGSHSIVGRSIHLYASSDCDAAVDSTAVASCVVGIRNFAASESTDTNGASQVLSEDPVSAHVTLVGGSSATGLSGEAWFVPTISGLVYVQMYVTGLTAGSTHAIHVHKYGDIHLATGLSAGLHLNPAGVNHGYPPSIHRHMGDLGNYTADADGTVSVSQLFDLLSFTASSGNIIGRGLIVHTLGDDGNPLNTNTSTGAAGGRLGMGVVGISARVPDGFVDPTSIGDTMTTEYTISDFRRVATTSAAAAATPVRQLQTKISKATAKMSSAKAKRAARTAARTASRTAAPRSRSEPSRK